MYKMIVFRRSFASIISKSTIKLPLQLNNTKQINRFITSTNESSKMNLNNDKHDSTLNVDDSEMSKYRSLGESWYYGEEFAALRLMNQLRVPFIRDALQLNESQNTSLPLNGISILDIGCGAGLLCEPLARLGARVTGIDTYDKTISLARNHSDNDKQLNGKINYHCTTIEEFCLNNTEAYDCIVSSEVLEHINDVDSFLKCSIKCLKPKGKLFITTINQTLNAYVGAIIFGEYILKLLPKGMHQYDKFVSPKALQLLLSDHGCSVTTIHGMCYNPLTRRWRWTQNTSINYALMAVKE